MKVSWPFGAALRREASSRLMLRWLKTVVVSDEEKAPGGDLEDDHCRSAVTISDDIRTGANVRVPG